MNRAQQRARAEFCRSLGANPESIAKRVANRRIPLLTRFESKYTPEPTSGCWLWTGSLSPLGYGQLKHRDGGTQAHRASWLLFRGEIGEKHVLHRCDNRACVNPDHLYLGTHQDNMKDRDSRGRGWWQRSEAA